jgi:hypothetical protein
MSIETLKAEYPWPVRTNARPNHHGWFSGAKYFPQFTGPQVKVYLELGTWLGKSALWFAKRCPNAIIICVDHWEGSPTRPDVQGHAKDRRLDKILPTLWETFAVNVRPKRDRIIPVKGDTLAGMQKVFDHDVKPDLLYVDACHSEDDVYRDVDGALRLFPDAQIIGDDWRMPQVRAGVYRALMEHGREGCLVSSDNVWSLKREEK